MRLLILSFCLACLSLPVASAASPNIVLIMCDNMGFSDVGCYGGEIQTPNIDRLAREGVRFTQFYNNAKCTTTRASLITGLYPRRSGGLLKDNMVTIPQVLKPAGYQSALSGKWHLGANKPNRPSDRGFDRYWCLLDGCSNFFDPSQPDPKFKGGRVRVVKHDDELVSSFPDDFYMTDQISDYAVECIEDFSQDEKPFFLHVCYTAPHYPLHAKPQDITRYIGKYRKGWEQLREERHRKQIGMGLIDPKWELPGRDREVSTWEEAENKKWQDQRMAVYAAMIDSMDQGIGRILERILPVEGLSLVPILEGGPRNPHEWLFWEWGGSRAVRQGDWKLCWDRGLKRWELYNLVADRTEMHDLAESSGDRVVEMSSAWLRWAKETGVSVK